MFRASYAKLFWQMIIRGTILPFLQQGKYYFLTPLFALKRGTMNKLVPYYSNYCCLSCWPSSSSRAVIKRASSQKNSWFFSFNGSSSFGEKKRHRKIHCNFWPTKLIPHLNSNSKIPIKEHEIQKKSLLKCINWKFRKKIYCWKKIYGKKLDLGPFDKKMTIIFFHLCVPNSFPNGWRR